MNIRHKDFNNSWIAVTLGIALAVSPIFRFSWDIAPQTILHLLLIPSLLCVLALRRISFTSLDGAFIAFFAVCSISLIGAPEKATVRNELLVLFDGLAVAWLAGFLSDEQKKKLFAIPLLAGLWLSVILLFNFMKDPLVYFSGPDIGIDVLVNMNTVAGYLLLCFPFSFLQWKDNTKESLYYRILSALLFSGLILTKSRTAIALATILLLLFILKEYGRYRFLIKYAAVIIVAFLAILTFLKTRSTVFLGDRLNWWQAAISMFAAHPLNGVGWGNFGNCYLVYRPNISLNTLYAHNIVLQILAETGIPGLIAFGVLGTQNYRIYREQIRASNKNDLALCTLLAIGGFFLYNLLDYSFYIPAVQLLFWFCVGTLVARTAETRSVSRYILPAALLLLLPLAYLLVLPFLASLHLQNGIYFQKHAEPVEALRAFGRASTLDPLASLSCHKSAETYFALYASLKKQEYLDLAIAREKEAVRRFPNNARYRADLSWLYRIAGNREQALASITSAVIYDHCNPDYRYARQSLQEDR